MLTRIQRIYAAKKYFMRLWMALARYRYTTVRASYIIIRCTLLSYLCADIRCQIKMRIDTTKLFGALAAYFDLLTYHTGL